MPSAPANYNLCIPVKLGPVASIDTLAKYAGTKTLFYVKVNQILEHNIYKVTIKSINQNKSQIVVITKEIEKDLGCGNFVPVLERDQRLNVLDYNRFAFYFVDKPMNMDGGRRSRKHRKSHRKHRKSHRKYRKSHRKSLRSK
jgi:hypothetical protein